jgi:tripartite-type tricarboxylate transporter receptor subunit TctC
LDDLGVEVVDDSTPDSLRNFVRDEIAKWSKVFKEAGIKPD